MVRSGSGKGAAGVTQVMGSSGFAVLQRQEVLREGTEGLAGPCPIPAPSPPSVLVLMGWGLLLGFYK